MFRIPGFLPGGSGSISGTEFLLFMYLFIAYSSFCVNYIFIKDSDSRRQCNIFQTTVIQYGLGVRILGFNPGGSGSVPGTGVVLIIYCLFFFLH